MNKVTRTVLSLIIFLIFAPFFNSISLILLMLISEGSLPNYRFMITIVGFSYLTTLIPSIILGICYSVSLKTRTKKTLLWFTPLIGCVVYVIYIIVFNMLFPLFGGAIYSTILIFSFISIGGTFVSTLIANIILKAQSL